MTFTVRVIKSLRAGRLERSLIVSCVSASCENKLLSEARLSFPSDLYYSTSIFVCDSKRS